MGFSSLFEPDPVPVQSAPPPTVANTKAHDVQADYEQKSARRRGLLSTILSDSNRQNSPMASSDSTGNTTLG